jgi:uncharacterized protein YuzE|tara:strand:- start:77 stop:448 length:372 start_codon:yes stop_codon:yes gene_type:complete
MDKFLNKVGDFDYDSRNDIIFFKVKDREYSHSIELSSLVIDLDKEDFIVGLQIINASEIFQISKDILRGVNGFRLQARINEGVIQINLSFGTVSRNNKIEYKPIIFERVDENFPDSEMICVSK